MWKNKVAKHEADTTYNVIINENIKCYLEPCSCVFWGNVTGHHKEHIQPVGTLALPQYNIPAC